MSGRHKSSKRQSRLAFTPLPSSSPAAKGYNKQIQDRAAAVSLDGSAKRRKIRDSDSGTGMGARMDGVNDSIPTPAASLQQSTREHLDDSDSEPVRSTQRLPSRKNTSTSRTISRQQPLDFSSARDPDSFSSPVKLSSPSRPRSSARAGMFSTQDQRQIVLSSDESEEELPSPGELLAKPKTKSKMSTNSGNGRATRSTQQRKPRPITVDSQSESDSEDIVVNTRPSRAVEDDSNDDGNEDMPTTLGTQRRKRARRTSRSSFISSSPPRLIESDSEVEIIEQPQKRRARANESESEAEDAVTPSRRKRVKRQRSKRDQKDLADDLEFLEPSSDVEALNRAPRNTQTRKKDARSKALEALRRRRSGQAAEPVPVQAVEEDEFEDDENGFDEDDETVPTQHVSSRQFFQEDDADDDFVEEGEDDTIGVPDILPIEFTRYASMKPRELFKHAVEWMVQKKINPAFKRDDGLYELTFRKLDDEVKGLAGSKFKSAAWTPEFTIALNSRPDIAFESIDRHEPEHYMRDHCDACNRSKHPATYQIQFQGKPYYPQTLEDVARDEGDDDSEPEDSTHDKDDEPSYDARGSEVPPANKIYYVGKFCMGNAQTAHALQHWRYHLNEWVVTWIIKSGYNTPERIVQRDGMKTKQREKLANEIVDRMEREGVVKTLWSDFRSQIDEARDSKQGRY